MIALQEKIDFKNDIWKTPYIPTIPTVVDGMENGVALLSLREKDDWLFHFEEICDIPSAFCENQDYDFEKIPGESWQKVTVPGSLIMQGFNIKNNCEYYYKRKITIPSSYDGKRVFVRFEGVYSNARVWINNKFVKQHTGGFTIWDCDISRFSDKEELTLVVGVTDIEGDKACPWNPDGIQMSNSAWASYYAHCNVGGILRDITLFTLPHDYIARNHIDTEFNDGYENATLSVSIEVHSSSSKIEIIADVVDENDKLVQSESFSLNHDYVNNSSFDATNLVMKPSKTWKLKHNNSNKNDCSYSKHYINTFSDKPAKCEAYAANISMSVQSPKLWDAEHPNMYKLKLSLKVNGDLKQTNTCQFGFREITYGGNKSTDKNKIYVNGKEIKLRGVCRHDVSHVYGRSLTREDIYNEILTYKRNNINHVRTSHYPASDYFLLVCDELGIYVEQENSACFKGANSFGIYNAPQDFVDTFAEMIEASRNHPSVIIWSLANETGFEKSYAFRTEYQYVKKVDKTRPVIFSYPHTVHSKPLPYDILSRHYKSVTSDLGDKKVPVLHDEFAHVSCYNIERLMRDNSCRLAWGESIKKGWDNIFKTDGALGCAIWGGVDDVFYIPDGCSELHQSHSKGDCAGYGEWGCIFDAYGREKPEAYLTKKAFSPVVLDIEKTKFGKSMTVYAENRFDHTSFNEVRMICKTDTGKILFNDFISENILPHSSGALTFTNPDECDVRICFYHGDYFVAEYTFTNKVAEKSTHFSNETMFAEFDKSDSLLGIKNNKGNIIAKGPLFTINGVTVKARNIKYKDNIWTARAYCHGLPAFKIKAEYKENKLFFSVGAENFLSAKIGIKEIGIEFILCSQIKSVSWNRKTDYSGYPEGHIGRSKGTALLEREACELNFDKYGEKPSWQWEKDMKNYFLFSKFLGTPLATNDFKTRRSDIMEYTVNFHNETKLRIQTDSDKISGFVDAFTSVENQLPKLQISKGNNYADLAWGNYKGERMHLNATDKFSFDVSILKYE